MKAIILSIITLISTITFSQETQAEIDNQIWIPFTKAWESNDGAGYNAIHSDDVWRINPGRLLVGDEYKKRNTDRMQGQISNSIIEFSFETRTSNGTNAYEVGYYRITRKADSGAQYFVGRFHVALRKIDGAWKITQDWDTGEINGVKLTAESLSNREFTHFQ
ncbi:nuclear transport factor 2 family protein [Ekhidna sp.]|uniref:YybH family protein n=1 Tax=Ekhidna sp. TaxID=2608089 RepID=UPI003299F487